MKVPLLVVSSRFACDVVVPVLPFPAALLLGVFMLDCVPQCLATLGFSCVLAVAAPLDLPTGF